MSQAPSYNPKSLFSQEHDFGLTQCQTIKFNNWKNIFGLSLLHLSILSFMILFLSIIIYILVQGYPELSWHYIFTPPEGGMDDTGGILYPLIGTIYIIGCSILIAAPLGIAGGIYLAEYSKNYKLIIKLARFCIQSLAGIPSVIYGLFALAFFSITLGFNSSLLSASLAISIMILPFIITTTEEAILSVPVTLKDASIALGATKIETISKLILPTAMPGIFTGIMLGIGRAISESAILILAAGGSITAMPRLFGLDYPLLLPDSGRTLAVHLYYQATSYNNSTKAFATAGILVILILILNYITFIFFKSKKSFNK